MDSFTPAELLSIEREFPGGLLAKQILDLFRPKGVRLSEATFRKYVQAGLLPRCRRVGQKGKHRGSQGLYPVESVRLINSIKKMMAEGHTLEEIKGSFVFFKNHIDQVEQGLADVLDGFESELLGRGLGLKQRRELAQRIEGLRARGQHLLRDISMLGSAVTARRDSPARRQTSVRSVSGSNR
jgi:hypothetical protein